MKKLLLLVIAIALVANTAFAQNVYRDFDTTTDFSRHKTYAWMERSVAEPFLAQSDELDRLVKAAVDRQLTRGKLSEQRADEADLLITYYVFSKDGRRPMILNYHESLLSRNSDIQRWQFEGNLIVDVVERETNRLVWRGVAPRALYELKKIEKKIDKAISRMFKGFPESKRGYDPDYKKANIIQLALWSWIIVTGILVFKR